MKAYKSSYYNMRVSHRDGVLLFNGKTGALIRLDTETADAMSKFLGPERPRDAGHGFSEWNPPEFGADALPRSVAESWDQLVEAGIFIEAEFDERGRLRDEYVSGRADSPLFVTVTTTLDCNMRCYYCYQKDGQLDHMSLETSDEVAEWVERRIIERDHRRIFFDWYGGEPMLNRAVIERLSARLVPFCEARGVRYRSAMICNGTNWPADVDRFLHDTRLSSVQFSVDGPQRFHDKRRGTIREGSPGRDASFGEVMKTIESVMGKTKVYFRINVDPWIGASCLEMIDDFAAKGWLEPDAKFHPYVAIINAMTEHCGFIAIANQFKDFEREFDKIQHEFYQRLAAYKGAMALETVEYYPSRRLINCAAVNNNAVIFGPNGLMYKCSLDVGDDFRAHGSLASSTGLELVSEKRMDPERWDRYDPFTHARCKECQYLPSCLGGCPKAQIERDEKQLSSQSAFFEGHFDRMIREYYDSSERA
jgi:uncharacterized protein